MRTKWNALMNFLIKSKHHRATSCYYYLSHRSIRRIAMMHDLQITSKQLCARTSFIYISARFDKKNKIKNPKEIEDTYFVRVFNWYRKGENNEMEFRTFPPRAKHGCRFFVFSPTSNIHFSR